MIYRILFLFACVFLLSLATPQPTLTTQAQTDSTACPALVQQAITVTQDSCDALGRNEVCYGNNQLSATDFDGAPLANFDNEGDITGITDLASLSTAEMNMDDGIWGVAVMSVQANLPETLPGQNVTFVLYGDASIEASPSDDMTAPLQAFQLTTGVGQPECREAPASGMLVQVPDGETVAVRINDIDLEIGSTVLLSGAGSGELHIRVFDGTVTVTINGESVTITTGYEIVITDGALPDADTFDTYDYDVSYTVMTSLLPHGLIIPMIVPPEYEWQESRVEFEVGDRFELLALGWVDLWTECEEQVANGEVPADTNCPDNIYDASGRGEITQEDVDLYGYPFVGMPLGGLVARVGDSDPFFVGFGGEFTASHAGTLQFFVNDDPTPDNAGAFIVIINLLE